MHLFQRQLARLCLSISAVVVLASCRGAASPAASSAAASPASPARSSAPAVVAPSSAKPAASTTAASIPASVKPAPSSPAAAAASAATGAGDKVVVAYTPSFSLAPLFLAIDKGYLKEQGIQADANVVQGGSDPIPPLATGQLDVSLGGVSAGTFAAIDRGVDIKIVDGVSRHPLQGQGISSPLLIRKAVYESGEVKSAGDLNGHKIAMNAPGGLAEYLWTKLLARHNLKLEGVNVTYLPFADQVVALKNGAVDAALVSDPFANDAIETGVGVLIADDSLPVPGLQSTFVFYGPKFIADRPDVGKRFLLGLEKGIRSAQGDSMYSAENLDIYSKWLKQPAATIKNQRSNVAFDASLQIDTSKLADQQQVFMQHGALKIAAPISPDKMIDPSFEKYVLDKLGPAK